MRMSGWILRCVVVAGLAAAPVAAFGVGSDDPAPPEPTETTTVCEEGLVWDAEKKLCVAIEESRLDDDALFGTARELAHHGRPEDALRVLDRMGDQARADVLNYRGFAHRKAGRLALALDYYDRALTLDPAYDLARSYRGMGYLETGRPDLARVDLEEIRRRSGRNSYPYWALKTAIAAAARDAY